jgi:hypothetical protein
METLNLGTLVHPTRRSDLGNLSPSFGEPIPRHLGFLQGVKILGLGGFLGGTSSAGTVRQHRSKFKT